MATQKPKNILIAPLDWGLGHTTRCVPVIRHIQALGHKVLIAGNEWQRSFIKTTFGDIETIGLEGYNITYSKWNRLGQIGVLSQLPGIHKTISSEHHWLRQIAKDFQLDGIISDNRYGLFHPEIPSVIMTHQLKVQTGMGNFFDRAVQKIHYKYIDRFHTTWIVDTATTPGLGGLLSHAAALPARSAYMGLLSQFENIAGTNNVDNSLLILLSGPEPSRSELSRILWQQALHHEGKVIFVDGSNRVAPPVQIPGHITYHQWLADKDLAPFLCNANMVICRSGYSTLMDLVALGKKAILIPTPGQTEQEYLGKHLHQQGVFYAAKQSGFDLKTALKEAAHFPFNSLELKGVYSSYKPVIDEWVNTL